MRFAYAKKWKVEKVKKWIEWASCCDTFWGLKEFWSSQEMSFLKREDDCVLQLINYLVQSGDISPGHLQRTKAGQRRLLEMRLNVKRMKKKIATFMDSGSTRWDAMFISYSVSLTPSTPIRFIICSAWGKKTHSLDISLNQNNVFLAYFLTSLPFSWPGFSWLRWDPTHPWPIWCCNMWQHQIWSSATGGQPLHSWSEAVWGHLEGDL